MYVAKKEEDLGTGASTTTSSLMVAILERALDVAHGSFHAARYPGGGLVSTRA